MLNLHNHPPKAEHSTQQYDLARRDVFRRDLAPKRLRAGNELSIAKEGVSVIGRRQTSTPEVIAPASLVEEFTRTALPIRWET